MQNGSFTGSRRWSKEVFLAQSNCFRQGHFHLVEGRGSGRLSADQVISDWLTLASLEAAETADELAIVSVC